MGYEPGKSILKQLNLRIDNDDRIALLGSNGNGKSTFAKFISGRLALQAGDLRVAPGLKIGFSRSTSWMTLYRMKHRSNMCAS